MNRRELLTGAALLGGVAQANAFGIGRMGLGEGRLGSVRNSHSAPAVTNLLLQPNNLLSAPWTGVLAGSGTALSNVVSAPGGLLAPDGTSQAFRLAFSGTGGSWAGISQVVNFPASTAGSFSFYMKSSVVGGATNVALLTDNNIAFSTGIYQKFTLTPSWQKFTLSGIIQTGGTAAQFIVTNLSSNTGSTVDPSCNGNIDICFGSVTNP